MKKHPPSARRGFLQRSAGLLLAGAALPATSSTTAVPGQPRTLAMVNTHTGERVSLAYALGDSLVPQALTRLNYFLRDHYSGAVGVIDPQLFDLLHRLRLELGAQQPFEVISGFRTAATNNTLRTTRGGGVARHSLHMDGMAIDVRLPGVPLPDLRDAALALHTGGVGFYPREQFVHVDTGRIRSW
jgi:uncharacterized protein YcbK (DUF882 family)